MRETERMAPRWRGVDEFTLALGAAGFSEVAVCGNHETGRPPTSADDSRSKRAGAQGPARLQGLRGLG